MPCNPAPGFRPEPGSAREAGQGSRAADGPDTKASVSPPFVGSLQLAL